ncbi:MAG: hypothetical protein ABIF92_00450, partial [archaeon]
MDEVITYDALREIQYNERKSEKLYDLDDTFYDGIEEYFSRTAKDEMTELELRNAKNILKDILDRRERKIMNHALTTVRSGLRIDTKAMTSKEEDLFKKLVTIIKKHREEANKPVKGKKKAEKKEEKGEGKKEENTEAEDKKQETE